jgi:hypothetical protein
MSGPSTWSAQRGLSRGENPAIGGEACPGFVSLERDECAAAEKPVTKKPLLMESVRHHQFW